jgi:hypothetical protein
MVIILFHTLYALQPLKIYCFKPFTIAFKDKKWGYDYKQSPWIWQNDIS